MAQAPVIQSRYSPSNSQVDPKRAIEELYANITALAGGIPTGAIMPMIVPEGDATIPGWLPMDGREWSQYDYKNLYVLVGDRFGTATSTTLFKLPDWRGKLPKGYSSDVSTSGRVGSEGTLTYDNVGGLTTMSLFFVGWYIKT